jgi:chromodomain-helicase-DNA-binding protein 1
LVKSSAKLVFLDKLLPKLQAEGHKVLIFSQMVRMLDLLEDYMNYKAFKFERIDGSMDRQSRAQSLTRFKTIPDRQVCALQIIICL